MDEFIEIHIYHGGNFRTTSRTRYVGGKLHIAKRVDIDSVTVCVFKNTAKYLGYMNADSFYYKFPDYDIFNLKPLSCDKDVHGLLDEFNRYGHSILQVYIVHGIDKYEPSEVETPFCLIPTDYSEENESEEMEDRESDSEKEVPDDLASIVSYDDSSCESDPNFDPKEVIDNENEVQLQCHIDGGDSVEEVESEYGDSDELRSLDSDDSSSGHKHRRRRYREFNEELDLVRDDVVLEIGSIYTDHKQFKRALRKHAIFNRFDYVLKRNHYTRVTAICKRNCGWRVHASLTQDKGAFQIKSLNPIHKQCSKHTINSKITGSWLAHRYLENFRDEPNWGCAALQGQVKRDYNVTVSVHKCYRAKKKANLILEGCAADQYAQLWSYCAALRKWNPGSTAVIKTNDNVFERLYICLDACKRGFKAGCRPIVCLDGCHLKGYFGGQLLAATGQDANGNMYPIAYAAVEAETKDSWVWFLKLLLHDIGSMEDNHWTFMSDQQKGLVEAIKLLAPNARHRFCVRHLYANFNKLFKGKMLKDLLWSAARATNEIMFGIYMNRIKELDVNAYEWLKKFDPTYWSRHAFSPEVKSDIIDNNLAEVFNKYIGKARDKPIIKMLETIRRLLMKRYHTKRDKMIGMNVKICPRIRKKMVKIRRDIASYLPHWGGDGQYEVEHCYGQRYVVDIRKRICGCRKWDITGIPCVHGLVGIDEDRGDEDDYVDPIYSKEVFMSAYTTLVKPVPSDEQWPKTPFTPLLPPGFRKKPGRPKKNRRKGEDEVATARTKLSQRGKKIVCSNCQTSGHNLRSCKSPLNSMRKIRKKSDNRGSTSQQVNQG